jgi:hypothetical protein
MRNKAGIMALTLLLLTPVLANAWNLTVKVAGGDTSNYTTVSYGTTTPPTVQKCVSGTFYLYPQTAAAIANVGVAATYKLDGAVSTLAAVTGLASGSHVVTVTYPAATPDTASSIVITQAVDGGMIYSKNLNNTWSATGLVGLKAGTLVPVSIAADFNHVIKSYTVAGTTTTVNGTVAGQVIAIDATATGVTPVTAVFALAQKTTATLFAPTSMTAGQVVSATITPNSNDDLAAVKPFSFQLDGGAFVAQASASYSLSALTVGTHTLVGQVNTANTGSFQTPAMTIAVVSATVTANEACVSCHSTQSPAIVTAYGASIHSQSTHSACGECHTEATPHSANINTLNVNPKTFVATAAVAGKYGPVAAGAVFCTGCHTTIPHQTSNLVAGLSCIVCHTSDSGKGGTGDAHAIKGASCVGCHAVGQSNPFTDKTLVNDNAGVRAVTGEFTKWSHHIVNAPGVDIVDEQCAVCHLEGTIGTYGFGVDGTKHMTDNKTHLRNAHTDAPMDWDPSAPDHTLMDNFCMSCHSATGADSPMNKQLQLLITPLTGITASPSNPFGDTISNQYDKMARPAVVDVAGQFNTGNNSHHAVMGKRYTGRTRGDGIVARTVSTAAFKGNSTAVMGGARSTIFDAGRFESTYTTLGNAAGETDQTGTLNGRNGGTSLGDDSTLHCGDCHTVGQFKAADVNVAPFNKAVIGAHGSNNEYMLRNYAGTDARHIGIQYTSAAVAIVDATKPYLLCYNCHVIAKYGTGSHLNEKAGANEDCNGAFNTRAEVNGAASKFVPATYYTGLGEDRLMSVVTEANKADGTSGATGGKYGAQTTGHGGNLGNIYGIQCANCHNSGVDNGFGGIHGSKIQTYTDAIGNTTKHERFMPGLGNALFVPGTLGGVTGGTVATYTIYSSNRTTVPSYTALPVRNLPYAAGRKIGSFTYATGGVTKDTNWEQKNAGLDNGATSATQGISGCYTLSVKGTVKVNALASAGYPADDVRLAPSDDMKAVDGSEVLDNWGGCEDHGGVAGRSSEPFVRGIIRPVTY